MRLFRCSEPENSVWVTTRKAADAFGSTALLYYSVERCLICFIRALDQATFDAVGGVATTTAGVAFRTGRADPSPRNPSTLILDPNALIFDLSKRVPDLIWGSGWWGSG
jgi:hypothetical protein